jgi:ribosomal protein S18 acetylase RimI-like enzyme
LKNKRFGTTTHPDYERLQSLLDQGNDDPHIHAIDMPYRLTSTWQDQECEIGLWERDSELVAWAVFQPPWFNVDYAMHPSLQGTLLETEIFSWGKEQMSKYANDTWSSFYGSFEFASDAPLAQITKKHLEAQGFQPFDWIVIQFTLDLKQNLPSPQLKSGFQIRPLRGISEAQVYVDLHRAAFDSNKMTLSWRERTLTHPDYRPELDLVVVNPNDEPVGFCICWTWQDAGHIEPLGVHPDHQGQGLGKALELTAAQILRDYGINTLHADHVSFNEKAIALSRKTGFKQFQNALRYYVPISPGN